ncbi:MAG TPA: hypothetical protein PLD25_01000 [Chloroflexota bacterium]|nr:hypothetical protein [Chloroflexota bacterium]
MMNKQILKLLPIALLFLLLGQVNKTNAQTNLLQNASFEMPYQANGEANSWGRWHRNSSQDQFNDCANGYAKLPHWSPETNPVLVRNGSVSQHVGNQWDTWNAGVFQTVPVTPGQVYRFSLWAYSFGSNNNFPGPSEGGLQSNVRVGIDPNGSGLWNDADVVWGATANPLDTWQQVSVEVTATGNQISVFTSANWGVQGVNQCRAHLDTWFDAAELIQVGPPPTNTPAPLPTQPPPPPQPVVTNTPVPPTPTFTPEVPPTNTPVPTDTPVPTNTPVPGGTICVNAFADDNANGQRDENEGFMGGVTFTIASSTQLVAQAVSNGSPQPVCFEGLDAGSYTVTQIVPGALEMTTAASATLELGVGQVIGVEFGSRVRSSVPTAVATEVAAAPDATIPPPVDNSGSTSSSSSSGVSWLAVGGLLLLVTAVALLGVLVFLVLRGQKTA